MNDELIGHFVEEGRELVQVAADDLLALEREPGDAARLDSAFRAVHTLKGSAGLFDFAPMGDALHAAEDLLGALRGSRVAPGRAEMDALLACIGAADDWIEAIAATGTLPAGAPATASGLVQALRVHSLRAPLGQPAPPPPPNPSDAPDWLAALLARHPALAAQDGLTGLRYAPARDCFFRGDDPMALARAIPNLLALDIATREQQQLDAFDPFACTLLIEALCAAPPEAVARVFRLVPDQVRIAAAPQRPRPASPAPVAAAAAGTRTLRIDAERIDALADIAGELIVAKNRLAHLVAEAGRAAPELARALSATQAEFDRLAGSLHRAVARTRLVPLGQTTRRLARLVRDLAGKLDKPVRFEVAGVDTEADKAIVDALFEPLLHLARNAIDHGIEPRAARLAAGKPAEGRIRLHAGRDGDQIVITLSDDGAGIDPARLRAAALARGVADAATIAALDDAAALDLVFAAGFSTAAAVTDLSGRGVGLDAVRMAIRAMGGEVGIASTPGQGATVRLRVPQAVVVTAVVLVTAAGEVFGIPVEAVAETARVPAGRILSVHGGRACVLKGRTVPVLGLADLLGLAGPPAGETASSGAGTGAGCKLVVVGSPGRQVAVEVDGIGARAEVAIRPLSGLLAGMDGLLGATLLGDGRVLLVLDIAELIG